jgi:mono/diheme cytochrome c family protein
MIRGILIGIAGTLVVLALGLYGGIKMGLMPANADARPSSMERWAARTSLHAAIAREQPKGPVPIPLTDDNLIAGVKLYAANCAVCHGGPDAERSKIARGLYQKPPQLAEDGVEDDPEGETYWKVQHGIRLTGMPAFSGTLDDDQLWQVTLFLKHMDSLPPAAERAWKAVKT